MPVLDRVVDTSLLDTKVDTYILGVDDFEGTNNTVEFTFGTSSKKVSGIAKLASVFLKKLFTLKGSNPVDMEEGTSFTTLIGSNMSDEEEAILVTQDSITEATEQVIQEQGNQDLPDDEKLSSAKLYSFEYITQDNLDISVDLISLAGNRAIVKVPRVELS